MALYLPVDVLYPRAPNEKPTWPVRIDTNHWLGQHVVDCYLMQSLHNTSTRGNGPLVLNNATLTTHLGEQVLYMPSSYYYADIENFTPPSITGSIFTRLNFDNDSGRQRFWGSDDKFEAMQRTSGTQNLGADIGESTGGTIANNQFSAGDWIDVIFTYNITTGDTACYINGLTGYTKNSSLSMPTFPDRFRLGARDGASGDWFDGAIAEFMIFDYEMTQADADRFFADRYQFLTPDI